MNGYLDCSHDQLNTYFKQLEVTDNVGDYLDTIKTIGGTYSMAIYDKRKQEFHLICDELGMGIVYYTDAGAQCHWAFRWKELVGALPQLKLDTKGLDEFMLYRWLMDSHTMAKEIKRVMPKQRVVISSSGTKTYQQQLLVYQPRTDNTSISKLVDETDLALNACFSRLRQKHNRIAVFLSGGVDSSLLLSKANEHCFQSLVAITSRFIGHKNPELGRAIQVAAHLNIEHIIVDISDADIAEALPSITRNLETPISYFNLVARELMLKALAGKVEAVVLGEGADGMYSLEVGGGSDALRFNAKQKYVQYIHPAIRRKIAKTLKKSGVNVIQRLGNIFEKNTLEYLREQGSIFNESDETNAEELIPSLKNMRKKRGCYFYQRFEPVDFDENITSKTVMQFTQSRGLYTQNRHQYFCYARLSEPYGIKAVFPFFSDEIKAIGLDLPLEFRSNELGTKPVLKTLAARHLPRDIIYAPKMGFETPLDSWIFNSEDFWRSILSDQKSCSIELFDQRIIQQLDPNRDNKLTFTALAIEIFLRQFDLRVRDEGIQNEQL
jgi:asparagine synthase (glutamine-hydrolysing)